MQPKDLITKARELRKNQTRHERILWRHLRTLGPRFRRQVPLDHYIADFACLEHRLIIELDGSQHAERSEEDEQRDRWLRSQGFMVVRVWNPDVISNIRGVLELIQRHLPPPP